MENSERMIINRMEVLLWMMIRILTKCVNRGSDKETAKMRTLLLQ